MAMGLFIVSHMKYEPQERVKKMQSLQNQAWLQM